MEVDRKIITEDLQFIWLPTGHRNGVPDGMTGFWESSDDDGKAVVTFPAGTVRVSAYAKFYEPTEAEIDQAIKERQEEGKGDWDRAALKLKDTE